MKPRKCLAYKKENWVRIPSELGWGNTTEGNSQKFAFCLGPKL